MSRSPIPDSPKHKAQLENASRSAGAIVEQSAQVRCCLAAMLAAQRLYLVARSMLESELTTGWEVVDPDLVALVLSQATQHKATAERYTARDVHAMLQESALPFIDVIAQHEEESQQPIFPETQSTTVEVANADPAQDAV